MRIAHCTAGTVGAGHLTRGLAIERGLARAGSDGYLATFDLRTAGTCFPVCEWLPGTDRIICGGGYNSFWEARTLGYFARTTFVPFPRHLDDQSWRVARCAGIEPKENGADQLAHWIAQG